MRSASAGHARCCRYIATRNVPMNISPVSMRWMMRLSTCHSRSRDGVPQGIRPDEIDGRRLKFLTVANEFTRQGLAIVSSDFKVVPTSIVSQQVRAK